MSITIRIVLTGLFLMSSFAAVESRGAPAQSGDGTMIVSPATNNAPGSSTGSFKFSFRAEAIGSWLAGSQVRLTVPETWTAPQTNAAGGAGYIKATLAGGTSVKIDSITGTGPWDVTLAYAGANGTGKGFDLAYTNVAVPDATGDYVFTAASMQAGGAFTNLEASPVITVLIRQPQDIAFPAISYAMTPNGLTLQASASSGLPVTFSLLSGPATLSGFSNLAFTATGTVRVAASQTGTVAWFPAVSITNTFPVYAGGALTLTPTLAMAACPTNVLRFRFRGDDIGAWQAGSQVRIRIPGTWPEPQSNSASAQGFVKVTLVSGTAASLNSISGTGPWDVTVNYAGAKDDTRGFDLAYTNITTPAAGFYAFETACQQRGAWYTNAALDTALQLVDGSDQTITFPGIENQLAGNDVALSASASSGLPVTFTVVRGPGAITGSTNLSFTSTGVVSVAASQNGTAYWRPAVSITNTFMVFAGGTLALTPSVVYGNTTTNVLKFSFRGDNVADWGAGSQIRLTVPAGWTEPQTNSAATAGYLRVAPVGTGGQIVSIAGIDGSGPWDVTVNYAGGKATNKGFDLNYTNVAPPAVTAIHTFDPVCRQFGLAFTNPALAPSILSVVKTNQTIIFSGIGTQLTTNKVVLDAATESGLAVSYAVSGPATLAGTTLSFTATGRVSVAASQAGNLYWNPAAPVTNTFMVLAGGTLTALPALATAGSITNSFRFQFKGDGIGAWGTGSTVRLTVPAEWPEPQKTEPGESGYVTVITNGTGGVASLGDIGGVGPWDVVIHYSGGNGTNRGFTLTYTNLVVPAMETTFTFPTICSQFGIDVINPAMQPGIAVVIKTNQTIDFPALADRIVTNPAVLNATASSGLPVGFVVLSGPAVLTGGTNLHFTNSGPVSVVASQPGDGDWHGAPPVTNTFYVYAGGSLALTPAEATESSSTNTLKFSFRGDGVAAWQSGSQIRISFPAAWTEPQTNSSTAPGFLRVTPVSGTTVSLASIAGDGPWDVTLNYQGAKEATRGFDLTCTNAAAPSIPGVQTFETLCRQFGRDFVNPSLNTSLLLVEGADQDIDFPPLPNQAATNKLTLKAVASSALQVTYAISGPCSVTGVTNLTFTNTGMVTVVASQGGNLNWHPAPSITNRFRVFAGGTMALNPDAVTADSATNQLTFSFRSDGIGAWGAGSQIRITIPGDWTPPQTNEPAGPGYVKATLASGTAVSIDSVSGTGPWDVTVNYQGAKEVTRGFNLAYSAVAAPAAAGTAFFGSLCRQAGEDFYNPSLNSEIMLVEGARQTIEFPPIPHQITTNKVVLNATASSGMTVTYAVSGPCAVAGVTNLTFTGTGTVTVVASQGGNLYWHPAPAVTNRFQVLAGGTMALTPAAIRTGSTTNVLKFAFRSEASGDWQAGSQIRLTVPAGWSAPQTQSPSDPGYLRLQAVGTGASATLDSISGEGPWDVVVNYAGAKAVTRGFDLSMTNAAAPAVEGSCLFETECRQFGIALTNEALNRTITLVQGSDQTIAFDPLPDQIATNKVGLKGSASSGLPVGFSVISGPAAIASATNLSFTGTGTVVVACSHVGTLNWNPASTSCSFTVSPAILVPTVTVKTKVYDGTTVGSTNTVALAGKAAGDTVVTISGATVQFEDKHIGTSKPATVSGLALGGVAAPKYILSITTVESSGDITARPITVRAVTDNAKVYDGTTASAVLPAITAGTLGAGDTGEWTQTFNNKNVGNGKTLTPAGAVNDGNGGSNYTVTFSTRLTGVILTRPATVSGASVSTKVYNGDTAAAIIGGDLVNGIDGDLLTLNSAIGVFAQAAAGQDIPVTPAFSLSGTDAGNYTLSQPALTGTITPKELTVTGATAANKIYDGSTAATITGAVLVGILAGDDVALDSLTGVFASAGPGEGIPVTATLTLAGADIGNYTLLQPEGLQASITPAADLLITSTGMGSDPLCGKVFRLGWQGADNCQYRVEYTDTLIPPAWSPLPGCAGIPGSNGVIRAADTNGLPGSRFYRIIQLTNP